MTKTINVVYTAHNARNSEYSVNHSVSFQVSEEVADDLTNQKINPFPCYINFPKGRKQTQLCQMVCSYAIMHDYWVLSSDCILEVSV